MVTLDEIRAVDRAHMAEHLRRFPEQMREAVSIGEQARLPRATASVREIVLTGLGGSAISGDLLRGYLAGELSVPFIVNRHYTLPAFVGPRTLVIVSSYSGNTEETIAAHREALRRRARVVCISSGGVTSQIARRRRSTLITIPGGLPPRAALGYSFIPLLIALARTGFVRDRSREIGETISMIKEAGERYARPDPEVNPALRTAQALAGRIGLFYASCELLEGVATRWRGQVEENGKALAFSHLLPEMNHNEIVGWQVGRDHMAGFQVVFLRDRADHARVQRRIDITRDLIRRRTERVTEVWTEGRSRLARLFSLIHLGDWMSLYLAVLHGVDPTPVDAIAHLKNELGRS